MSLSRGIALLLLLGMATTGWAQRTYSLDNFTGLKSEGEIPADLRKSLAEIYSEDKQRVRDYNDGKLTNRDRVLEVSYNISRLMSNGRILYGDPITRMLEHMADTLLKDYPQLRSELRFYTVKSPAVNAFATGQGMIFVTTGLVAQAENESQLAYILSHEIIHYYRKHNMEMITRRAKTADDEASRMANFLIYHNRSHEMENEADSLGLTLFYINSPYDKRVSDGVFDGMQYAMPREFSNGKLSDVAFNAANINVNGSHSWRLALFATNAVRLFTNAPLRSCNKSVRYFCVAGLVIVWLKVLRL